MFPFQVRCFRNVSPPPRKILAAPLVQLRFSIHVSQAFQCIQAFAYDGLYVLKKHRRSSYPRTSLQRLFGKARPILACELS